VLNTWNLALVMNSRRHFVSGRFLITLSTCSVANLTLLLLRKDSGGIPSFWRYNNNNNPRS
ncbi:MAG: hypothetical protein ABW185_07965, partial [Sedimenticola sp.]